jgi:hypothetical protein
MSFRAVKAILPRSVLRLINDDERVWSLLSSRYSERRLEAGVLYSRVTRPFAPVDARAFSRTVVSSLLEPWRDWEQTEKVARFRGLTFIEPAAGWLICSPRHLVRNCVIDTAFAPKPSFRDYLRTRLSGRANVREEAQLIHLRDNGEVNYWHFLNDLLGGRLRLADKAGLGAKVPLLLGRRALDQPFVQEILRDTEIGRRRLVVQDDQILRCRDVIHFETPRHSIDNVDFVLRTLAAPGGRSSGNKRVFLSRLPGSRRRISNLAEIESVCRQRGFEVVEAERMSVADQIELFSNVRYLVAVHGAGLTNIMFRRGAALSLVEIFPGTTFPPLERALPPPHYFWLSHACGFHYDALFAKAHGAAAFASDFEVDPVQLDKKIEQMLL